MKKVFILIGPKGSGKTFIGKIIEKRLNILFVMIEDIFRKIQSKHITSRENIIKGYHEVEVTIESILSENESVCFESTGLAKEFWLLVDNLKKKYEVRLISVFAPLDICLDRIQKRNSLVHISISMEDIRKLNQASADLQFKSALQIDTSKVSEDEIVDLFKPLTIR